MGWAAPATLGECGRALPEAHRCTAFYFNPTAVDDNGEVEMRLWNGAIGTEMPQDSTMRA